MGKCTLWNIWYHFSPVLTLRVSIESLWGIESKIKKREGKEGGLHSVKVKLCSWKETIFVKDKSAHAQTYEKDLTAFYPAHYSTGPSVNLMILLLS